MATKSTKTAPLAQLAKIRTGYSFRSRVENDPNGEIRILQMKDLDDVERGCTNGLTRMSAPDAKAHHMVQVGDLVFRSRGVSYGTALIRELPDPAVLAAPLLLVRAVHVLPRYLHWYLNLASTQSAIEAEAKGTSTRMVSKSTLEKLPIPVPSLERQQHIAAVAQLAEEEQALLGEIATQRRKLLERILTQAAQDTRRPPG